MDCIYFLDFIIIKCSLIISFYPCYFLVVIVCKISVFSHINDARGTVTKKYNLY